MQVREEEQKVFQEFKSPKNVAEAWSIYDTIAISSELYGAEQNAGWFVDFQTFGQQEQQSFFKTRTEGLVGLPYTNQQSSDSMDFAFIAHSIGLAIWAPVPNTEADPTPEDGQPNDVRRFDAVNGHWFGAELPRHMGIQFKVQQDIRIELPALHAPPGYGVTGGGTAFPQLPAVGTFGEIPFCSSNTQQGVPLLNNRYPLPYKIGIPRTSSIEGILHLSQYARDILTTMGTAPQSFVFNSATGAAPYTFFQKRYMIQLSLIGERLVQQRAEYHR
jgi:hypothetical protein